MRSLTEVGRGFNHAIFLSVSGHFRSGKELPARELFFGRMTVMFFGR